MFDIQKYAIKADLETRTDKRTVMIKIWVDRGEVMFEMVSPGTNRVMNDWDKAVSQEVEDAQEQAKRNSFKGSGKKGERIHTRDYQKEPENEHAGIHLSRRLQDEIVWFSEDSINFRVDIHRDPELVLLDADKDLKDVVIGKNEGIDNPFDKQRFPLVSLLGEPVNSGPLRNEVAVRDQRYYKYTVTVEGISKPLDPHVEGHDF
jgi:hypothetical protein